ncbi:MAG: D-alanyl-D-alanine carboxypeptidase [Clostridia bacterium]|nr:D-alanyl-D-alanine carboxypeptidase [Clostridia bacterium]
MKKLIIFICSLAIILTSLVLPVSAQNYLSSVETEKVKLNCEVDLLISLDDGSVIVEKNADKPYAPASLTKIMTALVVLKNTDDLNRVMTVNQAAIDSIAGTGSSTSGIKAGEQMSIYNMLCALLIPSGNDAAAALAIEYGGTIDGFVQMMNDTAKEIGCTNTHFDNPHGLDSATHKTTANDLAIMAKEALKFPAFETIVAQKTYMMPETNMNKERQLVNTNFLLNSAYVSYYNRNVKGIKTGSTEDAGRCLVSYASKDGYNYLAVAMGGDYRDSDGDGIEENQAFMDTNHMYNWAFKNLKYEVVTQEGQFICSVPLNYCWDMESVRLVALNEIMALVPQGNNSESVSFVPVDLPESIDAPVKKGDKIGTAKIMFAGQQIGTAELVVAEDANMSVLLYAKAMIQRVTSKTVFKIIFAVVVILVVAYAVMFFISNNRRRKKRALKMVKYNELQRNTRNNKNK